MIWLFFKQHRRFIIFFFALQLFVNLLIFIDVGIKGVSFIYLNLVWLVCLSLFFTYCYMRDRKQLQKYTSYEQDYFTTIEAYYSDMLSEKDVQLKGAKLQQLERQDELLAWVHEMKSPLTAMQLVTDKVQPYDVRERIENEWLRLHLLLDQQLHATRLMTIEQDMLFTDVSLRSIIAQEVKALRSWCFEKHIAIDMDEINQVVVSDAKWVGFIIRQLLSNAVKYSHIGGEVTIYVKEQDEQVMLYIQDKGIGIQPEDLPRVFRKSYTGTVGRETSAATGMGLYLAKQAAQSIHVQLNLQSKVNEGTTAQIVFPKMNDYVKTLRT